MLSPTRIALQIAEQIVDTPVPQGRGGKRRVQLFLLEQSTSAQTVEQLVDIPFSGGGLFGSLPDRVQQRGPSSRPLTFLLVVVLDRGLPHLLVLQMCYWVFFSNFSHGKKYGVPGRWRVRSCVGTSAHPR